MSRSRLLHVAANLGVATTFVATLVPWEPQLLSTTPNAWRTNLSAWIWIIGALTMAVLSLTRSAPREARTDYQALIAVSAMMVLPLFMRPATRFAATNWPTLEAAGAIFQVVGLSLMLVAWLYLGPHFGLLPANRGLVASGPFRLIRHPVYAAWLLTAFGNSMAAPGVRNFALVALTIPFMVWRIALEEELLDRDPQYLAYRQRVRWRVAPGMF
ncbi:MAG: methyltransferase family protein [Candidatus Binataceae bacterium]